MKNNGRVTCVKRGFAYPPSSPLSPDSETRTPLFALGPAGAEGPVRVCLCQEKEGWKEDMKNLFLERKRVAGTVKKNFLSTKENLHISTWYVAAWTLARQG